MTQQFVRLAEVRLTMPFRRMGTLQKFTSVHAVFQNHFNHERHLTNRNTYRVNRTAAMVEWKRLAS